MKNLVKSQEYSAFVYMTGISPIANGLSQSIINCFDEFSMVEDEMYYQYFGFTEQEVRDLCRNDEELYKNIRSWYNGYKSYNNESYFNSWSIYHALFNKKIKDYWNQTGRSDELVNVINFNINGVKDDILELIRGKEISIILGNYGTENFLKKSKNNKVKSNDVMKIELYSEMVTFGFLTYHDGKIAIPNKELKEKEDLKYYYKMIMNSDKMLKMVLNKNAEEMCNILQNSPIEKIKPGDKMDHDNLKCAIDFSYFNTKITYDINEEEGK